MKRAAFWTCLGAAGLIGLAACKGDDGGANDAFDAIVADMAADVTPDLPGDLGSVDAIADRGPVDPGETPDTVGPQDPGTPDDVSAQDTQGPDDTAEDAVMLASRGCIACHTDQAILEVLAPDDGSGTETGGG